MKNSLKEQAKKQKDKLLYLFRYRKDLLSEEEKNLLLEKENHIAAALKTRRNLEISIGESKKMVKKIEGKYGKVSIWREQIESLIVSLIIALAIRAYFLQPFRIPTGSMLPSLNGIQLIAQEKEKFPPMPIRWINFLTHGRKYVNLSFPRDKYLASSDLSRCVIGIRSYFGSSTLLLFHDGTRKKIPLPINLLAQKTDFFEKLEPSHLGLPKIPANAQIFRGYISAGDFLLVNKFSYHFRKPKRGEVIVFNTRNIEGIHRKFSGQEGGIHYIKRLVGIPGDELQISSPYLLINGKKPQEEGIRRVSEQKGRYASNLGYLNAKPEGRTLFLQKGEKIKMLKNQNPLKDEYFVLGDNTDNSFDSRYWGKLKGENLVGASGWVIWPFFGTGHWGKIK